MITRVLVRPPKLPSEPDEDLPCKLGGFGMTMCGNCNAVMKSIAVGAHCTACGAAVVSVERVGDRFEGDAA